MNISCIVAAATFVGDAWQNYTADAPTLFPFSINQSNNALDRGAFAVTARSSIVLLARILVLRPQPYSGFYGSP